MLDMVLYGYDDGLVHLVACDLAYARFSQIPVHCYSPFRLRLCALLLDLRYHCLDPGDISSDFLDPRRVVELIRRILESQIEKLFLGGYQFGR